MRFNSFNLAVSAIEHLLERTQAGEETEHLRTRHLQWKDRISLTAHDLRNPLTAARLNAQLLAIGAASRTPEQIEAIAGRILDSLARADRMLSEFLDEAAPTEAAAGESPAACDAGRVVRETLDGFPLTQSGRFVAELGPEIRGSWDRDGLRRALENLLTNAMKYGCPKSPITVRLERNPESARISVHNTGNPIPGERQAELLAEQAANSRTEKGWGLGLRLVKQFARQHRGRLLLESDTISGTTFTLELPLKHESGAAPGLSRTGPARSEEAGADPALSAPDPA